VTVDLYVPDIPRRLRLALVKEARTRNVSVNEVAASILADAYNVQRSPSNVSYVPLTSQAGRMVFRVPVAVRTKIRVHAARQGVTISGLVKVTLANALGVPPPDAKRKPRSRA
jgi:predicted HicB family RNase H-like nuclease